MRSRIALVVAAVLVLALGVGGALWWRQREADRDAAARAAVTAYASAWTAKDLAPVPFADDATKASFAPAVKGLGDAKVHVEAGDVTRDGDTATGTLSVTWTLPGEVPWSYTVPVRVEQSGDRWLVATPATGSPWHPDLAVDGAIGLERTSGERGDLLDRAGNPLMPLGTVHAVQIDPVNATPESAAELETVVGAAKGSLTQALAKATASGVEGPDPRDHLPRRGLGAASGPHRGPRGRHRADQPAAAGANPDLRAATARQLRRGDRRDGREEQRALRRR